MYSCYVNLVSAGKKNLLKFIRTFCSLFFKFSIYSFIHMFSFCALWYASDYFVVIALFI